MPPRLALITGVGRAGQVGESVARALASRGDHVLLVGHGLDEAGQRAAELAAAGWQATAYACDLADEAAVRALAARVQAAHGAMLHALVNLAGGFSLSGPVAESTLDEWEHLTRINLLTAYHTTRAFLPSLRGARGSIVYFASEAALPAAPVAGRWAYAAAKGAVVTLMRAVAQEERDAGVRANALAPTSIRTESNLAAMGPAARYVERDDVAAAAAFLCSDAARAVTGQVIRLG